jgi:hypothetical protein
MLPAPVPLDCAADAARALPRSDRAVQPWSFAAVSATVRRWYRAPASSFSLGRRCASSRRLVLTDLLANPEPGKVNHLLLLLLKSIGGIAPPYGGASRDLRLNCTWRHRHELAAAVQTMLSWEPKRIIFARGRWHDTNGTTELRNAFRLLLQ